jgi:hypothetical protein
LSCSSIPSKTVITTLMTIQFTRHSKRRLHRHSRRQLSSIIKTGFLQVCNSKKSSLLCVRKNNALDFPRPIGHFFVAIPLLANSRCKINDQLHNSGLSLSPMKFLCCKAP